MSESSAPEREPTPQPMPIGVRLWFIDSLAAHNYCHTRGDDPRGVDCRLKYRRFYEACRPDSPTFNPTCVRLRFD